jgi:hypothetical protein
MNTMKMTTQISAAKIRLPRELDFIFGSFCPMGSGARVRINTESVNALSVC